MSLLVGAWKQFTTSIFNGLSKNEADLHLNLHS